MTQTDLVRADRVSPVSSHAQSACSPENSGEPMTSSKDADNEDEETRPVQRQQHEETFREANYEANERAVLDASFFLYLLSPSSLNCVASEVELNTAYAAGRDASDAQH